MEGGNYLCCDFGMDIKAKCRGVQVILMRVVLCPNQTYSSKKNKIK